MSASVIHPELPEGDDVGIAGFDVVLDDIGIGKMGDLLFTFVFSAYFESAVADLKVGGC